MSVTLEELEKRLTALEGEVGRLSRSLNLTLEEKENRNGMNNVVWETEEEKRERIAAGQWALEQMGIKGEPIPAEELQARMRARGMNPEGTEFSQGIIDMREE